MMKLTHPGESIKYDCLEPLGLSVAEGARRLGISRGYLSKVVNGRSGITPEMAVRLDKAFGGGSETWYRLQAAYDIAKAQEDADSIEVERVAISATVCASTSAVMSAPVPT